MNNQNYAYCWLLYTEGESINQGTGKGNGFSIRLVRDPIVLNGIQINETDQTIGAGKSFQFTCTVTYSDQKTVDKTTDSEWSVSPPSAGTIDDNGLFTANSIYSGEATIRASFGGLTNETRIVVVAITQTGTMTDIDGNVYNTVKIGNQWWMAENLKVTRYRNGDAIPNVTGNSNWKNLSTGAFCAYNNNQSNAQVFGYLYNWYAVNDSRNIAPIGWHMPTDEEWKTLEKYLGMSQSQADDIIWRGTNEGGKLKEAGTAHWRAPNTGATNESGFSALPGGWRNGRYGEFSGVGGNACFWAATEDDVDKAWHRLLSFGDANVFRLDEDKRLGFSIRLVRD